MENHLIIGLGGTGGEVIRFFRKRVYEKFRSNSIPTESGACISYLWIDSSKNDLDNTQAWRTMGRSIALDPGDKLQINATTATILQNVDDYPGIYPWFGDKETWGNIIGGITDEAGGQRRRLGRLLFAWNIALFTERLSSHVNYLQRTSNNVRITFHICAGLAGGTGSGCIVDVISQIREEFPDDKIIVYAKLPETATLPPQGWVANTSYYRPNGYAALLELNAMSVKKYLPYDVRGRKDPITGKVKRMMTDMGIDAFNTIYVYANSNIHGRVLDVAGKELFQVAADFIYQKILGVRNGQLERLAQAENGDMNHEQEKGQNARSRRFLSFGIGRIEYPEQEIIEYVQYNFEKQAMLQFKYNNWTDSGFTERSEDEIGLSYATDLRNDRYGVFPKWCIDEDCLTLSKQIVNNPRNPWSEFGEDWSKLKHYINLVKEKSKTDWLNEFEALCTKRYQENFRGIGVSEFFRSQREGINGYAIHIRGLIERDLFEDWKNSKKSIIEIEKYLQALIDVNDTRLTRLDEKQQNKRQDIQNNIEPEIAKNRIAWNKIGWLSAILGGRNKLLKKHCELMIRKYKTLTEEAGYDYAQQLLRKVNEQLHDLHGKVQLLKTIITEAIKTIDIDISSRCITDISGKSTITFKMYNPAEIREKTRTIVRDERVNKNNVLNVRERLIRRNNDNFANFTKIIENNKTALTFINMFEDVCAESAINAMQGHVGVNILEKIAAEYRDDEERLGIFIEDKLELAGVLIRKNASEIVAGHNADTMQIKSDLLLPKYEDIYNFRNRFVERFRQIAGVAIEVKENNNSNEIIILSYTSNFPLRYLADVESLKKEYDDKMAIYNDPQHKILLHTEGDGSQFPSLYAYRWNADEREKFSPYIILAMSMKAVKYGFRGNFDNQEVYYIDNERKTSLRYKTYRSVVENIKEEEAKEIKEIVEQNLNTKDLSKERRDALKREIDDNIQKTIERECGANEHYWNRFIDGKNSAKQILDRDERRLIN
jgi:hypothetical protein